MRGGAGSTTCTSDSDAARESMVAASTSAVRSRYTPPGLPDKAARIARAIPIPMSSARFTRNAAFAYGFAIHLVQLFVVALLQVDDRAVTGSADLNHRKPVGGRIRKRHHPVQEAGRRDGETD